MNSFRSLVYPSARSNATGLICRDSGLVQVAISEKCQSTGQETKQEVSRMVRQPRPRVAS